MEPSIRNHDSARPMTEELFSTPFAADILLFLKVKQGCSEGELKDESCNGKSPEKALKLLTGKGLIESEDGQVRLTAKGEKAAEIIDLIEELLGKASYGEGEKR